jgi:3-hydroxyacyl-CoA dehydrogenase
VEIIKADSSLDVSHEFSMQFAKNLRKVVVPSNDIAGFIGNGHFMRDALHGIKEVERLSSDYSFPEAVHMVNKVSQDYLVRPMGIFQLIDYVGIDVVSFIMGVMNPHMDNEDLHSTLLDRMLDQGIKGGQHADGSQKDGFLKYEKGKILAIYDPDKKEYVDVSSFKDKCDKELGAMPASAILWKSAVRMKNKEEALQGFFNDLKASDTMGARLAVDYGRRSKAIGKALVADGVAHKDEDVNTVLLTGFFHVYGPINTYFD